MRTPRSLGFLRQFIIAMITLVLIATNGTASDALDLWFTKPATKWTEALPIGNGSLGGMVFGDQFGTIQVNENSVWAGTPIDRPPRVRSRALASSGSRAM